MIRGQGLGGLFRCRPDTRQDDGDDGEEDDGEDEGDVDNDEDEENVSTRVRMCVCLGLWLYVSVGHVIRRRGRPRQDWTTELLKFGSALMGRSHFERVLADRSEGADSRYKSELRNIFKP